MDLALPDDLAAFLRDGRQLDYDDGPTEIGAIRLKSFDDLHVSWFPMQGDSERTPDDPHLDEGGCYLLPGVDLVATSDFYEPSGLLIWLTVERRFGAWDSSHGLIYGYPSDVSWSLFVADPVTYLDALWNDELEPLEPWSSGHPYNAESVHRSLPDVPEWYEFEWTLRGRRENDVQIRWPVKFAIRIERTENAVTLNSRSSLPGEKWAEWQEDGSRTLSDDEWARLAEHLETGFWDPAVDDVPVDYSETDTIWSYTGWRRPTYRSVARFHGADHVGDESTKALGRCLAKLAGYVPPEAS